MRHRVLAKENMPFSEGGTTYLSLDRCEISLSLRLTSHYRRAGVKEMPEYNVALVSFPLRGTTRYLSGYTCEYNEMDMFSCRTTPYGEQYLRIE